MKTISDRGCVPLGSLQMKLRDRNDSPISVLMKQSNTHTFTCSHRREQGHFCAEQVLEKANMWTVLTLLAVGLASSQRSGTVSCRGPMWLVGCSPTAWVQSQWLIRVFATQERKKERNIHEDVVEGWGWWIENASEAVGVRIIDLSHSGGCWIGLGLTQRIIVLWAWKIKCQPEKSEQSRSNKVWIWKFESPRSDEPGKSESDQSVWAWKIRKPWLVTDPTTVMSCLRRKIWRIFEQWSESGGHDG